MKDLLMKDLSAGVAAFLRMTDRPDEFLAPIATRIYERVMGDLTKQLFPIRFRQGTLFLRAANDNWLREGKRRTKIICSAINNAAGCEIVSKVMLERGERPAERSYPQPVMEEPIMPVTPKELVDAATSIRDKKARRAFLEFGRTVCGTERGKQRKYHSE